MRPYEVAPYEVAPYEVGQVLYRASYIEWRAFTSITHSPEEGITQFYEMDTYTVIRTTPCGAWISFQNDPERWIGLTSKFAWRTPEEAVTSLLIRTKRNLEHCRRKLHLAGIRAKHLGVYEKADIMPFQRRTE